MQKICVCQKICVPSRAPTESTFALLCKLQAFSRKISTYASIDYIFRLKTCKFAKFVVPLQANNQSHTTLMKKTLYLALAACSMVLFACNSKPAADQAAEEQETLAVSEVENIDVEPAAEDLVQELDAIAEETATEEVAIEETAASEEVTAEAPAAEVAEINEEEPVYQFVDEAAVKSCTDQEMMNLLAKKMGDVDPDFDRERVMVPVRFIIEKDGSISHPEVTRSSGSEKIDAFAAQRVLDKMPKFKEPAKKSGKPVRSSLIVPVVFVK